MTEAQRAPRRDVTGILLLDKPVGISSNAALQRARRLYGARKAGHTGSLDPLASGMLPVCFGEATKVSGLLLDSAKTYVVCARLGTATDTGDAEGEVIEEVDGEPVTESALAVALEGFRGAIEQVPPMYSALKQGGERLYRLARRGERVERPARPVVIHELELLGLGDGVFRLRVRCSKGTYVRVLVEDLARAAGSVAHVIALRRLETGPFDASGMVALERLEALAGAGHAALDALLLPADAALAGLPALSLDADRTRRLRQGQKVAGEGGTEGAAVRLYGPGGRFLGLGEVEADGRIAPRRLFAAPAET